jgi:hypothetical protein
MQLPLGFKGLAVGFFEKKAYGRLNDSVRR